MEEGHPDLQKPLSAENILEIFLYVLCAPALAL